MTMLAKLRPVLALAYRFKPGRTFAQALVPAVGAGLLGVDWLPALAIAAGAGLAAFLQIWGEGGDMLADDRRVTGTKPARPVSITVPADGKMYDVDLTTGTVTEVADDDFEAKP